MKPRPKYNSRSAARNIAALQRVRRGNTIVLVTGILVLLVIIATAYVSRTQAGRITATAGQRVELREDLTREIADDLAAEIAGSLFVRPLEDSAANDLIDSPPALGAIAGSNHPRLPVQPSAVRYGRDIRDNNGDGTPDFFHGYNVAPYHVVPWTNWPDSDPANAMLPFGPGNKGGTFGGPDGFLRAEYNPVGNPGFGDCRWLRDLEPIRSNSAFADPGANFNPVDTTLGASPFPDVFSHWKHLSNVARPDNGWRIITDISDIGDVDNDTLGRLVTDMRLPVEQWLAAAPNSRNALMGGSVYNDASFWPEWSGWFGLTGGFTQWQNAYVYAPPGVNPIPGNYYCLRDLDGNNVPHADSNNNPRDLPQHEFVGLREGVADDPNWPLGTPRWNVGRVLTDTDGDGWTDSFWFLSPHTIEGGIRQIVGISIVDNCGMLNTNVATQFRRTGYGRKTTGLGPFDLALVGQLSNFPPQEQMSSSMWSTGFYDNPNHDFYTGNVPGYTTDLGVVPNNPIDGDPRNMMRTFDYLPENWADHLEQLGFPVGTTQLDIKERLAYWRQSGSRSLDPMAGSRFTPFSLADELELRMYHGNSYPWIFSRFEQSVQSRTANFDDSFVRANIDANNPGLSWQESSEYLDQLPSRMQVLDKRHQLTTYSSVRNDLMPPWLWEDADEPEFKIDLRHPDSNRDGEFLGDDDDNDGVADYPNDPGDDGDASQHREDLIHIRDALVRGLEDPLAATLRRSYFGNSGTAFQDTRLLSASLAANIRSYADDDATARIEYSVPIAPSLGVPPTSERFIGMEAQPFIVEAFIGHVYKAVVVPDTDVDGNIYGNAGDSVVIDDPGHRSTIIVVQIANPFDRPVDLSQFELSVYGNNVRLADTADPPALRFLQPATDTEPTTAIYYAIKNQLEDDTLSLRDRWRDFLDIESGDLPSDTIVRQVGVDIVSPSPWVIDDRDLYDSLPPDEDAVALYRVDDSYPTITQEILVDRIEHQSNRLFMGAIEDMAEDKPPAVPEPDSYDIALDGEQYPIESPYLGLGPSVPIAPGIEPYTHWVQWVRCTRSWGVDLNGDGAYTDFERNPRYVFADRTVVTPLGTPFSPTLSAIHPAQGTLYKGGNPYQFAKDPDEPDDGVAPDHPYWFHRDYMPMGPNALVAHKPTFFNLTGHDTYDVPDMPDKGWYSQPGGVDTDPETGLRLEFPLQMLQKDGDFEQVGEVLNVWMFGHNIKANEVTDPGTGQHIVLLDSAPPDHGTVTTFSEYMLNDAGTPGSPPFVGEDVLVNRLRPRPFDANGSNSINDGDVGLILCATDPVTPADRRIGYPAIPSGVRILDAFVCDGPGIEDVYDFDSAEPNLAIERLRRSPRLAGGFEGVGTPGMVNINTAPVEVMQAVPHWYRLVHETGRATEVDPVADPDPVLYNTAGQELVTAGDVVGAMLPRVMIPEAIWHYRERYNGKPYGDLLSTGVAGGANYQARPFAAPASMALRGDRGFASIGEIMLLTYFGGTPLSLETAEPSVTDHISSESWAIDQDISNDAVGPKPFVDGVSGAADQVSMRLSTDRVGGPLDLDCDDNDVLDSTQIASNPGLDLNPTDGILDACQTATSRIPRSPDRVAGDAEESTLLFSGASNIITTRSDTFTVYFRVRSFRQNTALGRPRWDATNPDYIVDDSRYVMLVDRTNVNRPGDKPRILYFEKLPN